MRALLDLIRNNEEAVHHMVCQDVLREASKHLWVLDPELGDAELIRLVAVELAKQSRG